MYETRIAGGDWQPIRAASASWDAAHKTVYGLDATGSMARAHAKVEVEVRYRSSEGQLEDDVERFEVECMALYQVKKLV